MNTQQMRRYCLHRYRVLGLAVAIGCIVIGLAIAPPAVAHWGDLATAEIVLDGTTETRMTLTYPTGLTAFADDDGSGRLSTAELIRHREALARQLEPAIALKDSRHQSPRLTLPAVDSASANARIAPGSHTTLLLSYTWAEPPTGLTIAYRFFPADAPEASCLATIAQDGRVTNHVFTPKEPTFTVRPAGAAALGSRAWFVTLIGAFLWGAVHSLSPGHGKTLVGAYLVGERATSRHALFLALMTTVTHTLGVFALGLITLAAARYVLPEQIYPWLGLISGAMIVAIGVNLVAQRSQRQRPSQPSAHAHDPSAAHVHAHSTHAPAELAHAHAHKNSPAPDHATHGHHAHHAHGHHHHAHDSAHHHHGGHSHSHLPVTANGTTTWRSLLLLGLSAGLVPCPAALVLLLGAIAFGDPISGLLLVVAFSLGLASVLAGLGLLMVTAKRVFKQVPLPRPQALQWLPLASAVGITVIGLGLSTRSILQLI